MERELYIWRLIAGGIAVEVEVRIEEVDERGQPSRRHRHISNLHPSSLSVTKRRRIKKYSNLNLQEDRVGEEASGRAV
jgi:hypothetical protein